MLGGGEAWDKHLHLHHYSYDPEDHVLDLWTRPSHPGCRAESDIIFVSRSNNSNSINLFTVNYGCS